MTGALPGPRIAAEGIPSLWIDRLESAAQLLNMADSLLEVVNGEWAFTDREGETITCGKALVPVLTIRGGQPVNLDWGPHSWGWLPEPGGYSRHLPGER